MSFHAVGFQDAPGNPWFSWQYVRDNYDTILGALREHVTLTAEAVVIAALIAVPLAVVAYWFRPLTGPILAVSGVLYTIPSLALLAFVAPVLGPTNPASVLIALVLYALLLIVRNSLAGLNQVPAEAQDAATGMGYGPLRSAVAGRPAVGPAGHRHRPAAGHRVDRGAGHGRRASSATAGWAT